MMAFDLVGENRTRLVCFESLTPVGGGGGQPRNSFGGTTEIEEKKRSILGGQFVFEGCIMVASCLRGDNNMPANVL